MKNRNIFKTFRLILIVLVVAQGFKVQAQTGEELLTVIAQNEVTLSVSQDALNTENQPSYQWYKDDIILAGATNPSYVITTVTAQDAGVYHAAVNFTSNGTPSTVQDRSIRLTVLPCETIPESEKQALLALHEATNGESWNTPWDLNAPECTWQGVTITNGTVVALNLEANNLQGQLPDALNNLANLTTLNLGNNALNGSIPGSIGGLTELTTLILENNQLTGNLPVALGSLSKLVILRLGDNALENEIPSSFCNLVELEELNLYNNNISGTLIPEFRIDAASQPIFSEIGRTKEPTRRWFNSNYCWIV